MDLMTGYMFFVLKKHQFKGEYPAPLSINELQQLQTPIYLILGDKDILFPYKGTIKIARKHIKPLMDIYIIPNTAHGIETSKTAMAALNTILNKKTAVFGIQNKVRYENEMA
jgi:pimeloyl-ACP methyl ester carboxylesterase